MRNLALLISYNGKAYHGWQAQENALSVAEVMQMAADRVFEKAGNIIGCGRTDAGVHAINYVCNLEVLTKIPEDKIYMALNANLPNDIRVKKAFFVPCDFHSRFCVKKKRYVYKILTGNVGDVFLSDRAWNVKYKLDFEKMKETCKFFLGTHDFKTFRASGSDTKTSVRTIYDLHLEKAGDVITLDVCADGFLYNMVRIITGTIVYAGCGKIDPLDIPDIIKSQMRTKAGITAPPHGLYMYSVEYDEKFGVNEKIKSDN